MKDRKEFYNILAEIDGKPFSEYETLSGDYDFARYVVKCGKISTAEDAGLPVFSIRIPQSIAELPGHLYDSPVRRAGLEDLLARNLFDAAGQIAWWENTDGLGAMWTRHTLDAFSGASGVKIADLDRDGKPDNFLLSIESLGQGDDVLIDGLLHVLVREGEFQAGCRFGIAHVLAELH